MKIPSNHRSEAIFADYRNHGEDAMKISTKKPKQRREIRSEEQEEKQKEKLHEIILKKLKGERVGFAGVRRDADSRYYSDSGSDGAGNSYGSSDESD